MKKSYGQFFIKVGLNGMIIKYLKDEVKKKMIIKDFEKYFRKIYLKHIKGKCRCFQKPAKKCIFAKWIDGEYTDENLREKYMNNGDK